MSTTTHSHDGTLVLADDRTAVDDQGLVDCLCCGHRVSVIGAYQIQSEIGPTMYAHVTCAEGFRLDQIAALHLMAVRGLGRNHGYGVPGKDADLLVRLR